MHRDFLSSQARNMPTLLIDMWDTLRHWLPRSFEPARCLQTSGVELALPGSCGRGRPNVDA
eukprot:5074905-Amphidinium_carterae.1